MTSAQPFKASRFRIGLIALALCSASATALAQWPEKPIKVIVPWPAGAGTDIVARTLLQPLADELKQPIYVENRPGANGGIGTALVARAPADGYSLVWATADTHAMNPHVYQKLPYKPLTEFVPVALVGYLPYGLISSASLPVKSITDIAALAKSGRSLTYGSWGVGGSGHVAMEMVRMRAGFDALHVPFTGSPPAIAAIAAGQVDIALVPMTVAKPQSEGGKIALLGVAYAKRIAGAPEVPTLAEQGVPVEAGTWVGVMAPAGTPKQVVDRLNAAIGKVLADKGFRKKLTEMYVEPADPMSSERFREFFVEEYRRWGETIKNAKIAMD